ncbi:enoyl-CoA hydratase-related protein [Novosphingobium malaysiense]|uniref:Enoyl-CoA hydratase n=1 Tax=Novosphingobium malaysiense TaxID=1348853 RepID=A0A0B1ZFX5_9SPHN|nr:enoyl-CoA hydratase-related protein [Novosphingobium malaysiense]KHK88127.1 enoyl-CoA hydratase [Novosphingobium malaysiense]
MTGAPVKVEREGHLTIITIDRPEARNALDAEAQRLMAAVMDDFSRDDEQWVAIVTATGDKAFCAGHDLRQQAETGDLFTPESGFGGLTARANLDKPVIAGVNGPAFGGGFEMVLAADIVVAADSAFFALPEPLVGLAALAGGIQRLPRLIGTIRANGILLTGRRVPALEALQLGLVNEIVPPGEVLAAARAWADRILACSPMSIRATKQAIRLSDGKDCLAAMREEWAWPAMVAMLESQDAQEGPLAFTQKRKPAWKGC